ncbi:ankyrin repeat domain-containing protein [Peribacillus tepidiphilus]|uniref:ankyrin repeat domain-containing protein n=1 Tax=Peribacillus tepidiphilus TaxID=2652445 RepID=UPI0012913E0B|nr:ankyrin repeat domain-containing protein [Peribacillus tepidiphilus]
MKNKKYWFLGIGVVGVVLFLLIMMNFQSQKEGSKKENDLFAQLLLNIQEGNKNEVKRLLERNSNIINEEKDDLTLLDYSLSYQQFDISTYLIEKGAKTSNIKEEPILVRIAQHLLDSAHETKGSVESKRKMLETALDKYGKEINRTDQQKNTALHIAAIKGDPYYTELLLQKGINTEAKNREGKTAFHLAVELGKIEVVKQLLARNPKLIEMTDQLGDNSLLIAVKNGRHEIINLFIQRKPELINSFNNDNRTALSIASEYGDAESVKILLQHNADKNIKSKEGKTALDYAKKWNHEDIIELLQK